MWNDTEQDSRGRGVQYIQKNFNTVSLKNQYNHKDVNKNFVRALNKLYKSYNPAPLNYIGVNFKYIKLENTSEDNHLYSKKNNTSFFWRHHMASHRLLKKHGTMGIQKNKKARSIPSVRNSSTWSTREYGWKPKEAKFYQIYA